MPTKMNDPRSFVNEHCRRAVEMHLDGIERLARLCGVNASNAHLFTLVSHTDNSRQELFFNGIQGSAKVGEIESGYRQSRSGGLEFYVTTKHSPVKVAQ